MAADPATPPIRSRLYPLVPQPRLTRPASPIGIFSMIDLPPDFDHGKCSPELQNIIDDMTQRYKATGLATPPTTPEEEVSVKRYRFWRRFLWLNGFRGGTD